ncbi:YfaZ family outer membrane protein [uncultured Comamonas sp.]|uniref:YfaZ family outer membrane protein n=1 Tax=uncultured Comamonas sp. TaxID=114710 RepID=UPI0025F53874|nr:YfaZ family outer membrane protein [uncultured Comamonas sp.]
MAQHTKTAAAALAMGLLTGTPVWAQDKAAADAWRFQLTPYVWMTGLDGSVRPFRGAPTVHVNKSFSDILETLDAAAFVNGTARKGSHVLQGDFSHAATSDKAALPLGMSAQAKIRQTSLTMTGGHHWALSPPSSLDLMAGFRLWQIKAEVNVPGVASAQSSTSFVDPVIAARWRYDIAQRWSGLLYADMGGLDVGSKFTWQVHASVNYQVKKNIFVSVGYRHLSVDYQDGGKRLDFSQSGPLLGATFRF